MTYTFGVEIECILPISKSPKKICQELKILGVECVVPGYTHDVIASWKIVVDRSLPAKGFEFVSPILKDEEGNKQVQIVSDYLASIGSTVSTQCGFHVHVGVPSQNQNIDFFKKLYMFYGNYEKIIDEMMPNSRRENMNRFCQSIRAKVDSTQFKTVTTINGLSNVFSDRYVKLNLLSFWRYGTVEFRHHSGTLNSTKMLSWINLCIKMVNNATTSDSQIPTQTQMPTVRAGTAKQKVLTALFAATRYNGLSVDMMNAIIGNNTWGTISEIAKHENVSVNFYRVGRDKFWYVDHSVATVDQGKDTFFKSLNMSALEISIFNNRVSTLNSTVEVV